MYEKVYQNECMQNKKFSQYILRFISSFSFANNFKTDFNIFPSQCKERSRSLSQ